MSRDIERIIEKERFNGSQKKKQKKPLQNRSFSKVSQNPLCTYMIPFHPPRAPPFSPSPDGDLHLLSIQPHLWVRKGRAKETAVAQAAQSAASEVGTRGLLFASSEGFSALMSARLSLRPGK